ncbi:MAG: hybrid sensor histidine kinase/response regulator [Melioribacteraceae bacterium]|nr:hybrid sensor histidine kinase/response regulator [Melioribacteraceae bacterium]
MKPKVLIVDDKLENLIVIESILKDMDIETIRALSGNEAITLSLEHEFALVLVDVQMPEMDGYETIELMRQENKNKDTPVIFVSAIYSENHYLIRGIETGAVDFMTKPIIPEILHGKVKVFVEYYLQKKDLQKQNQIKEEKNRELLILNEKLNESEQQLKELNYDKDILFSIIGHDLRSPISSLLGYAEILLKEFDDLSKEEIKEFISSIGSIGKNISNLITNLLDWARLQTGKIKKDPEIMNCKQKITESGSLFREIMKSKGIEFNIYGDSSATVFADEYMFNTIIRNIISNAIKFSNPNMPISINIKSVAEGTEISVIDSGIGMSREQVNNVFDIEKKKSTSGTNNESGTGLGLILCQEFIKKNKGKLSIESELGQGTRFIFTLPNREI